MASPPRTLRVPKTADARILGDPFPIQTNHCRTPGCANFGVPARTKRQARPGRARTGTFATKLNFDRQGPGARDRVQGCARARAPSARTRPSPRRSSASPTMPGRRNTVTPCKTEGCANQGLSIGAHRERYRKAGHYKEQPLLPVQGLPAPRARLAQAPPDRRREPGARRGRVLAHRQQVARCAARWRGPDSPAAGTTTRSSTSSTAAAGR